MAKSKKVRSKEPPNYRAVEFSCEMCCQSEYTWSGGLVCLAYGCKPVDHRHRCDDRVLKHPEPRKGR